MSETTNHLAREPVSDEQILAKARITYANGIEPVAGDWHLQPPGRHLACLLTAACMADGNDCKNELEAADLLGRSRSWIAGVVAGFDGLYLDPQGFIPSYLNGYSFGKTARKEFNPTSVLAEALRDA
jgi:hypothetical protein